jgi:Delta7-sterol 5-desaturase
MNYIQTILNSIIFLLTDNILYIIAIAVLLPLWAFVFPKVIKHRKNYPLKPLSTFKNQLSREAVFTLSTITIFTVITLGFDTLLKGVGYYKSFPVFEGIFGIVYQFLTLVLIFVWHDTYFFWTHKTMHHPSIFRYIHKVHHLSKDIEPLSSVSFHPFEALIQSLALIPILLLVPISFPVLFVYFVLEAIHTFYGHSGYELYSSGFTKHWFFKHFATSTHHNYHHERVGGHYGLYFTWWDKLTNKEFEDYHLRFEALAASNGKKILKLDQ